MSTLERLLGVVRRDLGADDARFEIGGRGPRDPHCIAHDLPDGWRLVALFDDPPTDVEEKRERLATLVASFAGTARDSLLPPSLRVSVRAELESVLYMLAERTGALRCVVVDDASPVLWGTSETPRLDADVHDLLAIAALDRDLTALGLELAVELARPELDAAELRARLGAAGLDEDASRVVARRVTGLRDATRPRSPDAWAASVLTARAVSRIRTRPREHHHDRQREVVQEPAFGYVAEAFASIYTVLLVYAGELNPLVAEGHTVKALPTIEKLVLSMPPVDPEDPVGGEVVRFRRPR